MIGSQLKRAPKRFLIKFILLLASLGLLVVSLTSLGKFWNYEESLQDISQQIKQRTTPESFSTLIQESINNSEFEEAKRYLEIAKEHRIELDYSDFKAQIQQNDSTVNRAVKNASDFAKGFVKGESTNMAGIAGALSADFTVIGDVRDLRSEYKKHQEGKPVNELIVALSATGVGLTAVTIGSMGVAAPAKTGVSTIKLAVKSQRLTKGFQKQLTQLSKNVFDWSAFTRTIKQDKQIDNIRRAAKVAYNPNAVTPLKKVAKQVNSIRQSSSSADALYMLKYVENVDDLRKLEKVTLKHGAKTKGLFKLLGKGVIRTTKVLKRSTELLLSVFGSILSGLASLFLFISRRAF